MAQSHKSPVRVAVLGASRGLGRAIVDQLLRVETGDEILAVARKVGGSGPTWVHADFSREDGQSACLAALESFMPHKIIYTAGGGPYGEFGSHAWRDHLWSYNVSLLFPARVAHWALGLGADRRPRQICFVGSSVAESQADKNAASYASTKHGLKGLWSTLREESDAIDLRLYSPGYMDTDLLPKGAPVRQRPLWSPKEVAKDLLQWLEAGPRHDYRRLAIHPGQE